MLLDKLREAKWLVLIAAFALVLFSPAADAGNTRSFFLGDEAALTAGAVVADVKGSGAVYYNPAGLGGEIYSRISLSGSAFMLRVREIPDALVNVIDGVSFSGDLSNTSFFLVPSSLVWSFNLNRDLSIGLGVYVTQTNLIDMHIDISRSLSEIGVSGDGELNLSANFQEQTLEYKAGPALGWQIRPGLRLGISLFGFYSNRAYNANLYSELYRNIPDTGWVEDFIMMEERRDWNATGFQVIAGMQWEVARDFHAGLTVQSPSFGVYQCEHLFVAEGFATVPGQDPHNDADMSFARDTKDEADFFLLEPMGVTLGLAYHGDKWSSSAEGMVMAPMDPENLIDGRELLWNAAAGGMFHFTPKISGALGVFTDNSFLKRPSYLGQEDVDFYGATLGVRMITPLKVLTQIGDDQPRPLVLSTTLSGRYAFGHGRTGTVVYDVIAHEHTFSTSDVFFHEISLYIGTGLSY